MLKGGWGGESGLKRIGDLLYIIRNPNASPAIYARIALLWTNAYAIIGDFPPKWEEWGAFLGEFQLEESPNLNYWVTAIAHCQNRGRDDPGSLASISIEFALSGEIDDSATKPLSRLWQAAQLLFRNPVSGECDQLGRFSDDAGKLIRKAQDAKARTPETKGLG